MVEPPMPTRALNVPLELPIVPTAVFELVQVPPVTMSVNVNEVPAQTEAGTPFITPGVGLTVTVIGVDIAPNELVVHVTAQRNCVVTDIDAA